MPSPTATPSTGNGDLLVPVSSGRADAALVWLHDELAVSIDPARRARLFVAIADAEEQRGQHAAATHALLLAFEADSTFREPVDRLVAWPRAGAPLELEGSLLDHLVDLSISPDDRIRALVLRAIFHWQRSDDLRALADLRDAAAVGQGTQIERVTAYLMLEALAGRSANSSAREYGLAQRADWAEDSTWRALLRLDQARLVAARGEVVAALDLVRAAKAQDSRTAWAALVLEEELLRENPGIHGTPDAQSRARERATTLAEMGALVANSIIDGSGRNTLGVPRWMRRPERAVDHWLSAASELLDLGQFEDAEAAIASALPVIESMSGADRRLAQTLATHARIRISERSGNRARAAELAAQGIDSEPDPAIAAALALRVAEQAAVRGDREASLKALEQALHRDPTSLAARTLQLDVLAHGNESVSYAFQLEALAEQMETDEARSRGFLVAAWAWSTLAGDSPSARAALSQAAMFGEPTEVVGRVARTLASLAADAGWYEDATRRLFAVAGTQEAKLELGLELVALRDARGDREAADKALHELSEVPAAAWPTAVLHALSPAPLAFARAEESDPTPTPKPFDLSQLASRETDSSWATAVRITAAMREQAQGNLAKAREHLSEIVRRSPTDVIASTYLMHLDRIAGDPNGAAQTAVAFATAAQDPDLSAAFFIQAGIEQWRAGRHDDAIDLFEAASPKARVAAQSILGWARFGADPDSPAARERALHAAATIWPDNWTVGLERFVAAALTGDTDDASRAIESVEQSASDSGALASALSRLAFSKAATDPAAVQRAIDRIAQRGPMATRLAAAERVRIARESQDPARVLRAAEAWFEAGGGLPASLEWITASIAVGDAREEMKARLAAASCLSGEARTALLARAALVHPRVDLDEHPPLMVEQSPTAQLANLDLSPPGSDPRRRAAVLQELGAALGEDSRIDALGLSAWSHFVAGHLEEAIAAFEAVVATRPSDLFAWEGLRTCAQRSGDRASLARACAELGALCADAKRAAAFWEQAALAWLDVGEDAQAERALEAGFTLDPGRPITFDKLFRRLRDSKNHGGLLRVVALRLRVTDEPSEIVKLAWEQARALREIGNSQGALRALEQVTMLDPNHVGALALLGEINIRQGKFEDAAAALSRLALLEGAQPKSRVTAAVAAVDLYENKLNRFDKSLEVLSAIHRAGISTLPVRERLARAAARGGAWSEAIATLELLMHERPDPAGRIEAARLAMAIHRDRLGSPQAAADAVRTLLTEAPSDAEGLEMLRRTEHPEDVRTRLLMSARAATVAQLQDDPTNIASIRQLRAIGRDLDDVPLQNAALGALGCLGAGDPETMPSSTRASADASQIATITISNALLHDILASGDAGPIADLFVLLAPTLSDALGPSLQACGVGRRDRVDPRSGLPLRNEIAAWAGAFGLGEFDLYIGGEDPLGVQGICGDPPALVVGPNIKSPLTTLTRARVARELFAIRRGTTILRWRDEVAIATIVAAACRLADIAMEHPPYAMLTEFERLIDKALSRKTRKSMVASCRSLVSSGGDPRLWSRRAICSQDRVAVLATGEPGVVLSEFCSTPTDQMAIKSNPRAEELLRYVLSESYLDARASLGLRP